MIDEWVTSMRAQGLSAATIRRRRISMGSLARVRPLAEVTAFDVERWLAGCRSQRTRRAYWSDARNFYSWALARGLVTESPVATVRRPRVPRSLPKPVAMGDARRAAEAAADNRVRLWVLLGALAGLRVGEIARLRLEDCRDGVILVRGGKGGRDRAVPMHPVVAAELATWGHEWIAPRLDGAGPCAPEWVSLALRRHLRACGIDSTGHGLRHGFATEAIRTEPVEVVAELLGHSDPVTTLGYARLARGRGEAAVRAIGW